jgi:hypothetical protein
VFSTSVSAQTILDDYVKEGLQSNLVLKQKHLTLEQAQRRGNNPFDRRDDRAPGRRKLIPVKKKRS